MRLWHLGSGILVVAVSLAIAREPEGRVALIVFLVGLGEVVVGVASLLALFQTIGSFGEARDLATHAEALLATVIVLAGGTALMSGLLFAGAWLVRAATS